MKNLSSLDKERLFSLFKQKRYKQALSVMQRQRHELSSMDLDDLTNVLFIESQCLYHLGHYRQSLLKLKTSIKVGAPLENLSLYARQKYSFGRILHKIGLIDRALEEYTEAYAFFRKLGNHERVVAALEQIAVLHFFKGNYAQARELGRQVIQRATNHGLAEHLVVGKLNLAQVQIFSGDLNSSLANVGDALSAKPDMRLSMRGSTLFGIARCYMLENVSAAESLCAAREFYSREFATRDEIVCLEYLGLNEYFAGNYDKAKEYYDGILSREEITASARAQTLRMLTDVYVAKAQWSQAAETAAMAETAILKINERIELGALDRARALIRANEGEVAGAREYFDKSISLLQEIGARYELALTFLTCGRSEVYDRDRRRYYLRRAHDLFVEMGVPRRVVEVEQELRRINPSLEVKGYTGGDAADNAGQEPRARDETGSPHSRTPVLIARSAAMLKLLEEVNRLAPTDLTILLTGETGTGKDLLAEYIHYRSGRPGQFVSVNSAAIPNEMAESELFGHAKGAFTGAQRDKRGLFELADQGTFYLNEIASCTPELQAKLLEVLENGRLRRLGETGKRRIRFRLIAASNQDFEKLIRQERFRADLYYRLRECQVELPPLRDRLDEIPALVEHFLREVGYQQDGQDLTDFSLRLGERLSERAWPGNVRALRAEIRRLWFAAGGDLDMLIQSAAEGDHRSDREQLLLALRQTDWNRSETARRLGISEGTVRHRIKKYNL
jgi:transcriptional regulator with AAA-type ATPase domain